MHNVFPVSILESIQRNLLLQYSHCSAPPPHTHGLSEATGARHRGHNINKTFPDFNLIGSWGEEPPQWLTHFGYRDSTGREWSLRNWDVERIHEGKEGKIIRKMMSDLLRLEGIRHEKDCYRLNVCVTPQLKLYVEILTPHVMVLAGGGFGEVIRS